MIHRRNTSNENLPPTIPHNLEEFTYSLVFGKRIMMAASASAESQFTLAACSPRGAGSCAPRNFPNPQEPLKGAQARCGALRGPQAAGTCDGTHVILIYRRNYCGTIKNSVQNMIDDTSVVRVCKW